MLSYQSMFHGLKRAHEYSGIGQVSNSLTKLWNRNEPDLEAAAWLTYYNNLVIDAAKTGKINSYENYPDVLSRINKATGGKRGRLPFFFQFSKNGRRNLNDRLSERKTYAKPNESIMNRICKQFDDIGNINLNYAGIPPFNWQMLMSEPCLQSDLNIINVFCEIDDNNISNIIELKYQDNPDLKYDIMCDDIIESLTRLCGSIENAYPHITKYLFTGDNLNKSSHKQMYWRIFGNIALEKLKQNLYSCDICPDCGAKIPSWVNNHMCLKNTRGFFECIDCGKICERINSRQCRCETCQTEYRRANKLANKRKHYKKKK